MKWSLYFTILTMGCNFTHRINTSNELQDQSNAQYISMINEKLNQLEVVLKERGIYIDSSFKTMNEVTKLEYIKRELKGYRIVDNQFTEMGYKSYFVNSDSNYIGSVSLSGYNSNLPWKLVMIYNDSTYEIPFDTNSLKFKYKLKPYKFGENEFKGFLVQGIDTYNFGNTFKVIR